MCTPDRYDRSLTRKAGNKLQCSCLGPQCCGVQIVPPNAKLLCSTGTNRCAEARGLGTVEGLPTAHRLSAEPNRISCMCPLPFPRPKERWDIPSSPYLHVKCAKWRRPRVTHVLLHFRAHVAGDCKSQLHGGRSSVCLGVEPAVWVQEKYSAVHASGNRRPPKSAGHKGCRRSLVYLTCTTHVCTHLGRVGVHGLSNDKANTPCADCCRIILHYSIMHCP